MPWLWNLYDWNYFIIYKHLWISQILWFIGWISIFYLKLGLLFASVTIYDVAVRLLKSNLIFFAVGTVFAYGQTNSGKTYTMRGSEAEPGVIPLSVRDLFRTIQQVLQPRPSCASWKLMCNFTFLYIYSIRFILDLTLVTFMRLGFSFASSVYTIPFNFRGLFIGMMHILCNWLIMASWSRDHLFMKKVIDLVLLGHINMSHGAAVTMLLLMKDTSDYNGKF